MAAISRGVALAVFLSAGAGGVEGDCCADHPALCRPLSPQPDARAEVVAYHSPGYYGSNDESWRNYDWDKITSVGRAYAPMKRVL